VLVHLSHMVPCGDRFDLSARFDIIMNTLRTQPGPTDVTSLQRSVRNRLGVEMTQDEIIGSLHILRERNIVSSVAGGWRLTNHGREQIETAWRQFIQEAEYATASWYESCVLPAEGKLEDATQDLLKEMLLVFLRTLFLAHGVESLSLITDVPIEVPKLDLDTILHSLRWPSDEIRLLGFKHFREIFAMSDDTVRSFLFGLVDQAVNYLCSVCHPDTITRLKETLSGRVLYLDSNAVYRLLGLQGKRRHEILVDTVKAAKRIGLNLAVTPVTAQEIERRLRFDERVIQRYPVPTNLIEVGIKYVSEDNYASTFWRENRELGTSVRDFIAHYRCWKDILLEYEVSVESEITNVPPPNLVEDLASKIRRAAEEAPGYEKSENAVEHDAFCLAFVMSLRGPVTKFLDCNSWFLTTDKLLVRLQRYDVQLRSQPPVSILPSQVLQLLSFSYPADNQYEETFVKVFAPSFVASDGLPATVVHEILGRIAKYRASPALAEKILSNNLITSRFLETEDQGERDEIVHEALRTELEALEARLQLATAAEEASEADRIRLKEQRKQLDELKKALASARREMERTRKLAYSLGMLVAVLAPWVLRNVGITVLIPRTWLLAWDAVCIFLWVYLCWGSQAARMLTDFVTFVSNLCRGL